MYDSGGIPSTGFNSQISELRTFVAHLPHVHILINVMLRKN